MVLYVGKKLYIIQILESFYVEIIIFPVIFDGQTPPGAFYVEIIIFPVIFDGQTPPDLRI